MASSHTKIDRFGRIVIPKSLREDLGLDPGSVLEIEKHGNRIVLSVRPEVPDLVRQDGVLVFTGEATADLEAAVERHRRERSARAAGWETR